MANAEESGQPPGGRHGDPPGRRQPGNGPVDAQVDQEPDSAPEQGLDPVECPPTHDDAGGAGEGREYDLLQHTEGEYPSAGSAERCHDGEFRRPPHGSADAHELERSGEQRQDREVDGSGEPDQPPIASFELT